MMPFAIQVAQFQLVILAQFKLVTYTYCIRRFSSSGFPGLSVGVVPPDLGGVAESQVIGVLV